MSSHLENLIERYSVLEVCRPGIQQAFDLLAATFHKNGKLLLCGNGGSAADSEHWAGGCLHLRASHADTACSGISSSYLQLPVTDAGRNFCFALAMKHTIEPTIYYEKCKTAKPVILRAEPCLSGLRRRQTFSRFLWR